MPQEILYGIVRSWFENRHWGFIIINTGEEFFAHRDRFQNRTGLPVGTKVFFTLDQFKGKKCADNIGQVAEEKLTPSAVKEGSAHVR